MGTIGGFVGVTLRNFQDMYRVSLQKGDKLETFEESGMILFITYSKNEMHYLVHEDDGAMAFVGEMYDETFTPKSAYQSIIKPELFQPIDGLFSYMVNRKNQITFRCGDSGFYPLYYTLTKDGVIFASTIKAILTTLEKPIPLNPLGLQRYLLYGYVPGIQTLFKDIQKVSPSSAVTINLTNKSQKIINHYHQPEEKFYPLTDLCHEIFLALNHSVSTILKHYPPPYGILLSGGLDSSLLSALVRNNTEKPVIAYTATSEFDESGDLAAAEQVAQYLNIRHEVITIDPETILSTAETIAETLDELSCQLHEVLPKFLLMKAASKDVNLLLTGDCMDASFFGHEAFYQSAEVLKWMDKIPPVIKQSGVSLIQTGLSKMKNYHPYNRENPGDHTEFITYIVTLKRLLASSLSRDTHHLIESYFHFLADTEENYLLPNVGNTSPKNYLENELPSQKDQSSDILTDLYEERKKDYKFVISRKTMSQYLAIAFRQPFKIDKRLQEIAKQLPTKLKQPQSQNTKHILRVTASKYHMLPETIIQRPKHPFFPFPLHNWLQKEFQLKNKKLLKILTNYQEIPYLNNHYLHNRLRRGNGRLLGKLLLLSLWYSNHKKFIHNEINM